MEEKKSKRKLVFWIIFAVIAVVLAYSITALYFFVFSPNNIRAKMIVWPFFSEANVAEMYEQASAEIQFTYVDPVDYVTVTEKTVGVNIAEDGFFVVPYISEFADFRNYEYASKTREGKSQLKVMTCAGVFDGVLLYSDEAFNVCVIKCERIVDKDQKIALPYLDIATVETTTSVREALFVSPIEKEDFYKCRVIKDSFVSLYNEVEIGDKIAMDYLIQGCVDVRVTLKNNQTDMDNKTTRVCCDRSGNVLGFSSYYFEFNEEDDEYETKYVFMPIYGAKSFFEDVVKAYREQKVYSNPLISELIAFDQVEVESYNLVALDNKNPENQNSFFYNGKWYNFSDGIKNYNQSLLKGVYLFDNFVHGQNKQIDVDSVIIGVTVNGREFEISGKIDFLTILYAVKSGDKVSFKYYGNFGDLDPNKELQTSDIMTVDWTI